MSDDASAGLPGLSGLSPDELDLLADLLAGEGTEEQVSQVAADPRLAGALADLEAAQVPVSADLAGLPEVEPPAGFLDRLTATLAAEPPYVPVAEPRAERTAEGDTAPAAGGSTVVPLARARSGAASKQPWVFRSAAAAVLVLVLAGGALLLANRNGGSSDNSSADSATALESTVPTSSTGTNYTSPDDVGKALPALLKGTSKAASAATAGSAAVPAVADPLARLRQPEELRGCLSSLGLDPGTTPLALDYARYNGTPALIVVLPSAKAGNVDVFALGADCTAAADHTLTFLRVAQPG